MITLFSFIKQYEATFDVKDIGRFIIEETNGKLTGLRTVWETAYGDKGTDPIPVPSESIIIPKVIEQLSEYLTGTRKEFNLDIEIPGSELQVKIWKSLLAIEYGKTISYSELAKTVNIPKAPRYIGT